MAFRLSVSSPLRSKRSFLSESLASPSTKDSLPPEGLATLHRGQLDDSEGSSELELLEIIAVHGLNGHREKSWIHTDERTGEQTFWLKDLLPPCIPNSRISTFGYVFDGASREELKEKAIKLLDEICNMEIPKLKRSFILIGHNLGGIIIKQALLMADTKSIYSVLTADTSLLVFFGSPQRATDLASWERLTCNLIYATKQDHQGRLSEGLRKLASVLKEVNQSYLAISRIYPTISLYEGEKMPSFGSYIVDRDAASMNVASEEVRVLPADHLRMCQLSSVDVEAFGLICESIRNSTNPDQKYIECWQTFAALEARDWPPASFKEVQSPDWIFEQDLYRRFVQHPECGNLELCGQTGSGLSYMASFLSTSLKRDIPGAIILQYSFDSRDSRQCSTFAMFASLTCQLLSLTPHCFAYVRHLFKLINEELSWSLENLWAFFRSMALCPAHGTTIVCIIDAVNKCGRHHDHFLNDLLLLAGSEFQLKTLTTNSCNSRDNSAIPTIDIDKESGLRSSIEEFVAQKLENLVLNNPSLVVFGDKLQRDILQSKPSFLSAALTCKVLENIQVRSTPSSLKREYTSLPRSLLEIYERCFLHVEGEAQSWAYDALFWISHAYRPLTISELATALAIKYHGPTCHVAENDIPWDLARDLIQVFHGFVRIQSGNVLLIHESAKDYLQDALHKSYPRCKAFALPGHSRFVNLCLDYLLTVDWLKVPSNIFEGEKPGPLTGELGLLLYSIEYWHRHYRLSTKVPSLAEKANQILENKECIQLWSQLQRYQRGKASKKQMFFSDPLALAAELGLNDIVLTRLERASCTDTDRTMALHLAALRGDLQFVNVLLAKRFEVQDALHLAAKRGYGEIVRRLIEYGADVKARDDTESTALHFASQSGYQSIVIPLIDANSDVNAVDINKSTPLHLAAEFGHFDVMKTLINARAEVGAKDSDGSTALHLATRAGQLEAMKLLISDQNDIYATDNDSKTALHLAAASGLLEPLDLLLKRHVWVDIMDDNGNTALHLAVEAGQLKVVQRLLDEVPNMEITNDIGTPLHVAALNGHIEIMIRLLDAKADPFAANGEERTPLHLAAYRGHTGTVQKLIEIQKSFELTGSDKNTKSSNYSGEEEVESHNRAFIDTKDGSGATPLHLAAASGSQATIQALIQAEASVNIFDYSGYTPLMRAVRKGDLNGAKLLVKAGAEVDLAIVFVSPIHVAAEYSNFTMIRFLLESGANPEMPDINENKPLHVAAKAGKGEGVQEFIDCGVDIDPFNDEGATPLHLAAAGGHFEVVQLLVEAGHDTNVSDQTSSTPLHAAVKAGDLRTLNFLIERGANFRAIDNKNQMPIHIAAEYGRIEMIRRLLQQKSKKYQLNSVDRTGRTALHIASEMDFPEIVRILIDEGSKLDDKDTDGLTALQLAVQKGHVNTVRLLLENGASLEAENTQGSTVLHFAAEHGHIEIVQLLLSKGVEKALLDSLDGSDRTPLYWAIHGRHLETVKLLLDAGGDINASPKWPAMYAAAYHSRISIVEELLSRGFDREIWETCGENKWTPLHAGFDTPEVIQLLLNAGADVNAITSDGRTALHLAAYGEYTSTVQILIDKNANLRIPDNNGSTPLHEAVDKAKIVEMLLKSGVEVDVLNNEGQTPLFRAAHRGQLESFELLLKYGADLWKTDGNGSTPLHSACSSGQLSLVQAILKTDDCRLEVKDDNGCTPLWRAVENGNKKVVEVLLRTEKVHKNQQNNNGQTLLLMATELIEHHGVEVMELLLKEGGDIGDGAEGILMLVAGKGLKGLVKLLLDRNINPDATDEHGWTPAIMATATDKAEVLGILPDIKRSPLLPTSFSGTDKSDIIMLEDEDTAVISIGEDSDCSIRANHPISPLKTTFYFEIEILHLDDTFAVAIGLCDGGTALNKFPGWTTSAWAYHSDDGKKYHDANFGFDYSETCAVGDSMGCFLDIHSGRLTFYKNGKPCNEEPAFEDVRGRLFPIVAMNGTGTKVRINLKDRVRDMNRRPSVTSEGASSSIQSFSQR